MSGLNYENTRAVFIVKYCLRIVVRYKNLKSLENFYFSSDLKASLLHSLL